ncbi:MAG: hypothetical protein KKG93_06955 [Bacteroidetes bacterium]|nr:hypothetical protein [Bacteroidota bacterium]
MKLINFLFFIFAFLLFRCSTEPNNYRGELIELTKIDISVTEAYIHIKLISQNPDHQVFLQRDGKEILSFNAEIKDTIIIDTSLSKSTSYSYRAFLSKQNEIVGISNKITLTTLEPTSHDISWETYSFGATQFTSNSSFNDVAIIDENSIWAVGEVYLTDTLGNYDSEPYAAAYWNGAEWELMKVNYRRFGTNRILPGTLNAVHADNIQNLYVASSAVFLKNNGEVWQEKAFFMTEIPFDGQVKKIGGITSTNLYCVGNNGSIYYVSDNSWVKLESGTNYTIYDIWGYINPITQNEEMLCAATDYYEINNSQLLRITDVIKVNSINLNTERFAASVWTKKGFPIYVCGDGIFTNKSGTWREVNIGVNYFTNDVRGNGLNDLFIIGDFGLIAHFNGLDWRVYADVFNAGYKSLSVNDDMIAAVGQRSGNAIVTIGRRN